MNLPVFDAHDITGPHGDADVGVPPVQAAEPVLRLRAGVDGPHLSLPAEGQSVSHWEPGAKDYMFRIIPTEVSGRRFVISPPRR